VCRCGGGEQEYDYSEERVVDRIPVFTTQPQKKLVNEGSQIRYLPNPSCPPPFLTEDRGVEKCPEAKMSLCKKYKEEVPLMVTSLKIGEFSVMNICSVAYNGYVQ
jgi:hypothetical protein